MNYFEQAKKDFNDLKAVVNAVNNAFSNGNCSSLVTRDDLNHLCYLLRGHNFNGELFDVNYGCICATILLGINHFELSKSVEVWDDKNCECLDTDFEIED